MEATNQNLDSVLKKLRKLQNLYEGAKKINSEGEANAAAAAIQRLLIQYNLSMDEIGTDEEKSKDTVLEEKVDGFTYKRVSEVNGSFVCYTFFVNGIFANVFK